jgi:hypothetical protein
MWQRMYNAENVFSLNSVAYGSSENGGSWLSARNQPAWRRSHLAVNPGGGSSVAAISNLWRRNICRLAERRRISSAAGVMHAAIAY